MKAHLKKALSYILAMAMILAMLPMQYAAATAPSGPYISLGSATFYEGKYYYADAVVMGDNIRTIQIGLADSVTGGDEIFLPAAPSGFSVSSSSAGNDYTKRINLNPGIAADTVQSYLRSVGFTVASPAQTVHIVISTESIAQDTFYYAGTGHYYQFIPDTNSSWVQAYNNTKTENYMGRTGYLATVTSLGEDTFIYDLSGGKTGWLGGTILVNTGSSGDPLYYDNFDINSAVPNGWYWACGPEKGTTFYNINSLYPDHDAANAAVQDALNTAHYHNWLRGQDFEPNNATEYVDPSDESYETCLTILKLAGSPGKQGTVFSWNDVRYDHVNSMETDDYSAKGYFVEYGNQHTGDTGSDSSSFGADSGTLDRPYTATVNTYVNGVPAAAPGSVVLMQGGAAVCTANSIATGVYAAPAVNGTYDIYIKNEDTGADITISSADNSAAVGYYRVNFSVTNSNAPGSTISATAGGASITNGTAVLNGKAVVITATGAGADTYTYLWSGAGTNGETAAAITIPSLGGAVNALCTVTGTIITNTATVNTYTDGALAAAPGSVELRKSSVAVYTLSSSVTGVYTASAMDGTYDIYINNEDTGTDITISGAANSAEVYYYSVNFSVTNSNAPGSTVSATVGGASITSGAKVLSGKPVVLTATGAGADTYTYLWSGNGTSGQTTAAITIPSLGAAVNASCAVTGTIVPTAYAADIYTATDGVFAPVPGSVELKQGGVTVYTAGNAATGRYTANAVDGTYDIYINNEDTGKDITISGTAAGVQVDYYTVSFTVHNAGTASGSTVTATAGGTPISSGAAVLLGKPVTITAEGAGADSYAYLWSGPGTNSETTAAINIPSLSGAVDVLCIITGTTVQPTYAANILTYTDSFPAAAPGGVELWQGGVLQYTTSAMDTGCYTASAESGTYDIYINNADTGINIVISGAGASVYVDYYTVSFSAQDAGTSSGSTVSATAGGTSITSGTAVLLGKEITITASGAGADSYTYLWSGSGTNGETAAAITIPALNGTVNALCTVTGTTNPLNFPAVISTYTDGAPAAAPGSVELKQGGVTVYTLSGSSAGVYTASAANGIYDVFIGNLDTGADITVSGAAAGAAVNYYTVGFSVKDTGTASGSAISATAGGTPINSGAKVLAGKAVVLTAAGAGADTYTYLWSGSGTGGETSQAITIPALNGMVNALCTVTGTANTFTQGTLEEKSDDTTVTAEGLFTQDARLIITPIPEGEADRVELESLLSGKQTAAAFEAHIEPADAFKAPLTLSFKLGEQYNGRTVYILHKLNSGSVEQYTVTVENGAAVITVTELSPFLLTVDPPVAITAQPQSVTVVTGQTASFTVTAAGTEPLTYQWQKRTGANASWEDIPGAVNPSHTTSQANLSNSGFMYRVTVTDAYGRSVTTEAATLTVTNAPEPPATGDHSQPILYMALILLFMLSSVLLLKKRKAA